MDAPAVVWPERYCVTCKRVVSTEIGALQNGVAMVKRQYVDKNGKDAWAFDLYCQPSCWEHSNVQ